MLDRQVTNCPDVNEKQFHRESLEDTGEDIKRLQEKYIYMKAWSLMCL